MLVLGYAKKLYLGIAIKVMFGRNNECNDGKS